MVTEIFSVAEGCFQVISTLFLDYLKVIQGYFQVISTLFPDYFQVVQGCFERKETSPVRESFFKFF